MNSYEKQYKLLLKYILFHGKGQYVREGANSIAMFGLSLEFEAEHGEFPMLTSKEMFFKNVKYELHWLLSGSTSIDYLIKNDVKIWNMWSRDDGTIGNTYGKLLRNFEGKDQLKSAINKFENDLQSRRNVISLWSPLFVESGEIAPCYPLIQFVIINDTINIMVHQRSGDMFIGIPYDMAVFYLLLRLIADKYKLIPGKVRINIGNAHIYTEHVEAVEKYISNKEYPLPFLNNDQLGLINFNTEKVSIEAYKHCEFIKAKIIL